MGFIEYLDVFLDAPTDERRSAIMQQRAAARANIPKVRPVMPPFNFGPRESLTELRPRHLCMVEEHGCERHGYDRDALGDYFLANWYRLFGPLRRSKAVEVPSDQFRKEVMVSRLLNLIEMTAEYAAERSGLIQANAAFRNADSTVTGCLREYP
jgi:hypothetical protein